MRNEIITKINELFDENIELKYQLKQQSEYYDNLNENNRNNEVYVMNNIQKKLYDIGLNYLFDEGFTTCSIQPYNNEKPYTFEEWIDYCINLQNFNDISKNEFIKLFSEKMKEEYEKRKEKENKKDE